jgi:AbrB family looped-hinge helix DNA binding protein
LIYDLFIDIILLDKIEAYMTMVTISTKHQIVIPKEIRQKLKLKPGQKLLIIQTGDRLELISVKSIKETRGFLKGIDTSVEREVNRI